MDNKIKIFENLHLCGNLLRRNVHHRSDSLRGKARLFAILSNSPDGITQGELAEKLGIRAPSMSELVQKLSDRGFIIKEQDELDRRSFKIFLTQEGKDRVNEIKSEKTEFINNLFKDYAEHDIEQLAQLLEKLTQSLKAITDNDNDITEHHQRRHRDRHAEGSRGDRHHHRHDDSHGRKRHSRGHHDRGILSDTDIDA